MLRLYWFIACFWGCFLLALRASPETPQDAFSKTSELEALVDAEASVDDPAAALRAQEPVVPPAQDIKPAGVSPELGAEVSNFFALEDRIISLFEAYEAAVVRVHVSVKEGLDKTKEGGVRMMIGTGFFVSPQGHVITTALVAQDAVRVWVDHKGKPYLAECVASDDTSGIAILKVVDVPEGLPFIPLVAPTTPPKIGSFCVSINREIGLSAAPSLGVVKNNAEVSYSLPTEHIRTDLPCPMASAGGPVFKLRTHELIGVQLGVVSQSASSLVIPVEAVKKIYEDVLNTQKVQYAWLGISVRLEHDWEKGVSYIVVDAVDPASPAQEHDIKEGDKVISIGRRRVITIGDLNAALFFASVGQYVTVTTQRNDKVMHADVRVRQRPDNLPRITSAYWSNRPAVAPDPKDLPKDEPKAPVGPEKAQPLSPLPPIDPNENYFSVMPPAGRDASLHP